MDLCKSSGLSYFCGMLVVLFSGCGSPGLDTRLEAYDGEFPMECHIPRSHSIESQLEASGVLDSKSTWAYVLEEGE